MLHGDPALGDETPREALAHPAVSGGLGHRKQRVHCYMSMPLARTTFDGDQDPCRAIAAGCVIRGRHRTHLWVWTQTLTSSRAGGRHDGSHVGVVGAGG